MRERELKLGNQAHGTGDLVSLPMRERELKRPLCGVGRPADCVAPHAGARIETPAVSGVWWMTVSLPMRERELKPQDEYDWWIDMMSLPMRERELKPGVDIA